MPPRPVRLLAVLGLLAALAACGDDPEAPQDPAATSSPTATADLGAVPEGIEVTGEFGKEPEVKWTAPVEVEDLARTVLIEGKGEDLTEGSTLFAHVWIGNGTSQTQAYSDFGDKPGMLTLGPETLPALARGLEGAAVGSRVEIASPPADAWGSQGNTQLGVGASDTVVFVVDVVDTLPGGPEGGVRKPAAWAPTIVETDGDPSALDFSDTPEPSGTLLRTTLIEGKGAPVAKGQRLYVDYLGQVPGSDAPFDESYSRGTPFDFVIGQGQVVQGWDEGLIGVEVGSRVILQIPPELGYGEAGQPDVGISGTDTMYFVVDVLAAT